MLEASGFQRQLQVSLSELPTCNLLSVAISVD